MFYCVHSSHAGSHVNLIKVILDLLIRSTLYNNFFFESNTYFHSLTFKKNNIFMIQIALHQQIYKSIYIHYRTPSNPKRVEHTWVNTTLNVAFLVIMATLVGLGPHVSFLTWLDPSNLRILLRAAARNYNNHFLFSIIDECLHMFFYLTFSFN